MMILFGNLSLVQLPARLERLSLLPPTLKP
jgi:hypothetical protein